jgi:RNA polymerase sporulation-specific sigma factor
MKSQNKEIYINEPISFDKDGNQQSIADVFRDPVNIEDVAELRIDLKMLYEFINDELDLRERQIICKRYGLIHSGKGQLRVEKAMTQQEVATSLEISRSYVSRIEKKALEKLKRRFDEINWCDYEMIMSVAHKPTHSSEQSENRLPKASA